MLKIKFEIKLGWVYIYILYVYIRRGEFIVYERKAYKESGKAN